MGIYLLLLLSLCVSVFAKPYTILTTDDSISILSKLVAGDTATFQAGTHTITASASFNWNGTPTAPIIITGVSGAKIQRPNSAWNIWDPQGSNFVISNLEFVGGSRGLRFGEKGDCSNILLQDLKVHDTAATAVNFNDVGRIYNNITIRRVEVYNTGADTSECFYAGCNTNNCIFRNSLFDNVFCHDTKSALDGYGSGINLKSGSYNNIVRNSVFWDTKGPGVFFYDSYDNGVNIAEGNLVVNSGDTGIQVTAGAIIRNNIVINSANSGIAGTINQLKTGTQPRNITILHNTVVGSIYDVCLRGNSWGDSSMTVANNAFFCESAPSGAFKINGDQSTAKWFNNGYIGGSAPAGAAAGVYVLQSVATELVSPSTNNFYPKSTSQLLNAANVQYSTDIDFNCNARSLSSPTVGAYQYSSASNPGWQITKASKTCESTTTTTTTTSAVTSTTEAASTSTTGTAPVVPTSAQVQWSSQSTVEVNETEFTVNMGKILGVSDLSTIVVSNFSCVPVTKRAGFAVSAVVTCVGTQAAQAAENLKQEIATNSTGFETRVESVTTFTAPTVEVTVEYSDATTTTAGVTTDSGNTTDDDVSGVASMAPVWMAVLVIVFATLL